MEKNISIEALKKNILKGVTGAYGTYSFTDNGEISNVSQYLQVVEK